MSLLTPPDFEITLFENMQEPEDEDLHQHTFYEIIWIDEGTSKQTIDYKDYQILPQSLFFISSWQLRAESWVQGVVVQFQPDFLYTQTSTGNSLPWRIV